MGTPRTRTDISPMRPVDVDEVMEIERQAFNAPWSRDIFLEELARDWAYVDVLRERPGGKVVGFVNYWLVRDEVHILNVAIHFDARRRGHASRMLGHVVQFARREGCRYLTLEVRRSNDAAIRLYRKHAFRPVGIRPNYYVENQEDAIVMLLDLG